MSAAAAIAQSLSPETGTPPSSSATVAKVSAARRSKAAAPEALPRP
jgi:hypothetical protein